jgi:predicted Zn-dependent peptidase
VKVFHLCSILLTVPFCLPAQDLKTFEKKVTEFTLGNGLHFIIVERHEAPVVSFHTYVNAGSVDDPSGATGIAHMFEHMAFKGTDSIGSRDWSAEKKALHEVEGIYDLLEAERNKGPKADNDRTQTLETQLKMAIERAQAYVDPNAYTRIIEENGGAGLNAGTSNDSTEYFYSLPSNRIELWFLLESQRFLHPVFREFYKERDVVMEENRMRVESSPQGKLLQAYTATAFEAHPYRNPPGGWPSDISRLREKDALEFYQKFYGPGNITIAIVGDVDPAQARRMADKYFSPLPSRPLPPSFVTQEPPQDGPKTAVVQSAAQPVLIEGYKRPSMYDADDPVFDVISEIFSGGRTGILYKELVRDKRLALAAESGDNFPGSRYPNSFLFFIMPSEGKTVTENEKALDEIIERLKSEKVDAQTLARVKTKTRAGLIRRLDSNAGLANLLTTYQALYGDWRKLFTSIDDLDKVTANDVQRVMKKYFVASSRTVAYTVPAPETPAEAGRPSAGEAK